MRNDRTVKGSGARLGLALLSAALASSHAVAGDTPAQANAVTAPAFSGEAVRMFRDPVTGEMRAPTPQEAAALKADRGNAKVREPLVVKVHGGRMVSAVVGTRPLDELIGRPDVNGQVVVQHRAEAETQVAGKTNQREER
jgi:hypothetical protein